MIGRQIESNPGTPRFPIFLGLCCAALVSVSVVSLNPGFAIFCIPLATVASALMMARERPFSMQLNATDLMVGDSFESIPLASFKSVTAEKSTSGNGQFPIFVTHAGGLLTIPASINDSSTAVYEFLCNNFESNVTANIPLALKDYADEQFATFGDEKVYCFSARETIAPRPHRPRLRAFSLGMVVGGVLWLLAGIVTPEWFAGGVVVVVFGFLFFLLTFAQPATGTQHIKNWRNSFLIVSPAGIGLVQGPLKGKLRWDELRRVKLNEKVKSFRLSAASAQKGILLDVTGSQIVIADIYNEPLFNVHQKIMGYYDGT